MRSEEEGPTTIPEVVDDPLAVLRLLVRVVRGEDEQALTLLLVSRVHGQDGAQILARRGGNVVVLLQGSLEDTRTNYKNKNSTCICLIKQVWRIAVTNRRAHGNVVNVVDGNDLVEVATINLGSKAINLSLVVLGEDTKMVACTAMVRTSSDTPMKIQ